MSLMDKLRENYAVLGLVLAMGCGDSTQRNAVPCGSDADCKGERLCVEGFCEDSGSSTSENDDSSSNLGEICTRYFNQCSTPTIGEMIRGKSDQETNCSPYMVPGGLTKGCDHRPEENHNYLENGLSCEDDFHEYNRICDYSCTPEVFLNACDTSCKKEQIDWYYGCLNAAPLPLDEYHIPCSYLYCGVETETCFDDVYQPNDAIVNCLLEHGWIDQ